MNSEQKSVLDLICEVARKAAYARDSFMNNDIDKTGVRLEQVQDLLNKAIGEFQNYCVFLGDKKNE